MIYVVGGGSIASGKVSSRNNNQCRQRFKRRILRVNHEIYNGSGEVSWIFFLSHVNGRTILALFIPAVGMQPMGGIPQRPLYLVSMMDSARGLRGYVLPLWGATGVCSACRKGWACGVAEKGSDWLGS